MTRPLRALTLWPEWAWAIHALDKRVENRTWRIPVGWYVLHAGRNIGGRPGETARADGLHGLAMMASRSGSFVHPARFGEIVTSAALGCFRVCGHDAPGEGDLGGWRVPEQVGNRIDDYRPFPAPIPCGGAQGLWVPPVDVLDAARAVLP